MGAARYTNPPTIHPTESYTHVVEVLEGRPVYVSGQVALDPEGNLVGEGDLRAQTHQVFANLRAALDVAGATFDDVVKLTYFVLDASQIPLVREVRNEYLAAADRPASTAVQVGGLVQPEFLIEAVAIV